MSALLSVPLVIIAALLLVAGVVFGLHDRSVLVPPPEAVAEGFVRELETERYERALAYLTADLQSRTGREDLKAWTERLLSRTGDILDVQGEPFHISLETAEARARLKTKRAGEPALRFTLRREQGVWKISRLDSLAATALEAGGAEK